MNKHEQDFTNALLEIEKFSTRLNDHIRYFDDSKAINVLKCAIIDFQTMMG